MPPRPSWTGGSASLLADTRPAFDPPAGSSLRQPHDPPAPDADDPAARALDVRFSDGCWCVIGRDGAAVPISLHGQPVRAFDPGWEPVRVVTLFAPVHLLALRHDDGNAASWYLDAQMRWVAGPVRSLPPELLHPLRAQLLALFRLLMVRIVAVAKAELVPEAAELTLLCEGTILELLDLVLEDLLPLLQVVDLREPDADGRLRTAGLEPGRVRATLAGSLQADYRTLMRDGAMCCVSPLDGAEAVAEAGLFLPERQTAYRFVGHGGSHGFYLATYGYHDVKAAVYVPELNLCCVAATLPHGRTFVLRLIGHMAAHQLRLVPYLSRPRIKGVVTFCGVFPSLHIGHVVWNELSALEELVQTFQPSDLPFVCVLDVPNGNEVYGPLDALFPELAGRVLRPQVPERDAAAFIYDNDIFAIRVTAHYVQAAVGRRIQALALRDPRLAEDRAMARRLDGEGRSCILLGLRVGNRTVPDQAGFLIGAIDHLAHRLGPITVVLDGSNARLGLDATTFYGSFGPPGQEEAVIEELRIVLALRRRYQGSRVTIVGTVGAPIAASIFWIMQSRFFVAPWGAGLAKYRWVCNKPGFVVTNRHNLSHPEGDLLIYQSPETVEAPTPMHLIALDQVADAPGAAGFYANFQPDAAAVAAGIDRLIAETAGQPQASGASCSGAG